MAPCSSRRASANGIATPTMNMKAGWIRSQKAIHTQGMCSNWLAMPVKVGLRAANSARPKPPDTSTNMMNPRYASNAR